MCNSDFKNVIHERCKCIPIYLIIMLAKTWLLCRSSCIGNAKFLFLHVLTHKYKKTEKKTQNVPNENFLTFVHVVWIPYFCKKYRIKYKHIKKIQRSYMKNVC